MVLAEALASNFHVQFTPLKLAIALSFTLLAGCGTKQTAKVKTVPTPQPARVGMKEQGIASWYGDPYHGRQAANGELYNMEELTAAHKTLPFETWVRVKNLANQKTTTVRITDRGPFIEGRIVDLSRAAAKEIDLIRPGTVKVQLTVIHPPSSAAKAWFAVQVAAVEDHKDAQKILKNAAQFPAARINEKAGTGPAKFRVIVGHEKSADAARDLLRQVRQQFQGAFIVRM